MNVAPGVFGGNLRLALSAFESYMVLVPLVLKQGFDYKCGQQKDNRYIFTPDYDK